MSLLLPSSPPCQTSSRSWSRSRNVSSHASSTNGIRFSNGDADEPAVQAKVWMIHCVTNLELSPFLFSVVGSTDRMKGLMRFRIYFFARLSPNHKILQLVTGWPLRMCQTSRWLQNISSVLVHGPWMSTEGWTQPEWSPCSNPNTR